MEERGKRDRRGVAGDTYRRDSGRQVHEVKKCSFSDVTSDSDLEHGCRRARCGV